MWHIFLSAELFPERAGRKQKGDASTEPPTRATKQTFLFPPSNKGAGTTHPNYISATRHKLYSRAAKINHIQKSVLNCSDLILPARLLPLRNKKAPTKRLLLDESDQTSASLGGTGMLHTTHNYFWTSWSSSYHLASLLKCFKPQVSFRSWLTLLPYGPVKIHIQRCSKNKSWRITKGQTALRNTDGIMAVYRYIQVG